MTIESLCQQYRDVPRPILIKTEALRVGVRFTPDAKKALRSVDTQFKGYNIFANVRGATQSEARRVPKDFCLSDGAMVINPLDPSSPYAIDALDGNFYFCDESGPVDQVSFLPARAWIKGYLEDGTPLLAIAQVVGRDKIFCTLNHYCEH